MFAKSQEALRRHKITVYDGGIIVTLINFFIDCVVMGHGERFGIDSAAVSLGLILMKLSEIEKKLPPTKEEIEDAYRAATRDGWRPPRRKTG